MNNSRLLLTLDEINIDELKLVGSKALTLATLQRNRLNVPFGVVVTTAFFEAQIDHYAYRPIWSGSPDVAVTESSLEFLADFLKTTPLAPRLQAKFNHKIGAIFPESAQSFAVRSSAIDEDRADRSFAGTYLTELGVPRDLLLVSLTRCWASALTGNAIQYRLKHGISIQKIKIAVLIQPMIAADRAGVGFSLNPVTGAHDEMIVEATELSGAAIVSGSLTPYRYHLERRPPAYPILKKIPGDTLNLADEPLNSQYLTEIAMRLAQIEAILGQPQDVEWLYKAEELVILQARPITALPNARLRYFDTEWISANYRNAIPALPSPLLMSLMMRSQGYGQRFFQNLGLDVTGVGPYFSEIYGRVYLNLSLLKRVLAQLGCDPIGFMSGSGYIPQPWLTTALRYDWLTILQAKMPYLRLLSAALGLPNTVQHYQQMSEALVNALPELAATPPEVLGQFKQREQLYAALFAPRLLLFGILAALKILLKYMLNPMIIAENHSLNFSALRPNDATTERRVGLQKLGRLAVEAPQVYLYLTSIGQTYVDYETVLADTAFLAEFNQFLAEQGQRAVYEVDMRCPRFSEQTHILLRTISHYASQTQNGMSSEAPSAAASSSVGHWFKQLPTVIRKESGPAWWRRVCAYLPAFMVRQLYQLDERLQTAEAKGVAAVRAWDLRLARQWVDAGYLEDVDDYFWLTMAEIERCIVAEQDASVNLKPAVQARRQSYQAYAAIRVPHQLKDSDMPRLTLNADKSADVLAATLMGLPVSPGQVQGVIKILAEVDRPDQLDPGVILVAKSTDIELLPFFSYASGLIVEIGGMLSHGSIIAREYGIPAVSGITNAQKRLKSGDRVLLDGSTGVVQLLEDDEQ